MIERNLSVARQRAANGERMIRQMEALLARLANGGHETAGASDLLALMRETQRSYENDCATTLLC